MGPNDSGPIVENDPPTGGLPDAVSTKDVELDRAETDRQAQRRRDIVLGIALLLLLLGSGYFVSQDKVQAETVLTGFLGLLGGYFLGRSDGSGPAS